MEMSCDEAVLQKTNEDIRNEYSTSLLNLSVIKVSLLNPITFGGNYIKERVINVLCFKKSTKWVSVVSLVVVAVFFTGFTFNRVELVAVEPPEMPHIQDESAIDDVNWWADWYWSEYESALDNVNWWADWFNSLFQEQQAHVSASPSQLSSEVVNDPLPLPVSPNDNVSASRRIAPIQITTVEELEVAFSTLEALGIEMVKLGLGMLAARISEWKNIGLQMEALGDEMGAWGDAINNFADSHPVSHQEAMEIARNYLGIHPSRNFTNRSFDIQDGRTVWRFTFRGYGQISVDANTGEIVHP